MYKLMKSVRVVLEHLVRGPITSYRQVEVNRYRAFSAAAAACDSANDNADARHYILNGAGQEYYGGTWIS
jgi:hypothetical protein